MRIFSRLAALAAAFSIPLAAAQDAVPHLVLAVPAEHPVELRAVSVRTEISGSLAHTEVALTFHNPNARVLEGELQFPLLDGQQVVAMAMDLDGKLRDAVPVDKAQGQRVFEDVTRARIDPALLSLTQGNNYKLRVYPIPPQRDKIVVLRYAETLAARAGKQVYRLPLHYADRLPQLAVYVRVTGAAGMPAVARGELAAPAFARDGDGFALRVARRDFRGRGTLEIDVPAATGPQAFTQLHEGRTYFHAEVPVRVRRAPRALPRAVTIVWDSSGSGRARNHARELALVDAYLAKARDVDVRLLRVRDTAEAPQHFTVRNGDGRALRRALESTVYDGATNLGAMGADADAQEVLLFSDGIGNFAESRLPAFRMPLYAISSAAKADAVLLRNAAEGSGGRFIDLAATPAADAIDALLTDATRAVAIDAAGATGIVAPTPYPAQGRYAFAGILAAPATSVRVTFAHPGGRRQEVVVPVAAGRNPTVQAAAMWARYRITGLEADYDGNRDEIKRIGKAFAIVTRETSLIVLDRVEDYARYDIVPPPELVPAYEALRRGAGERLASDEKAQVERVVRRFEDKQRWWQREFPRDARPVAAAVGKNEALRPREADVGQLASRDRPRRAQEATAAPAAPAAARKLAADAVAGAGTGTAARRAGGKDDAGSAVAAIRLRKWTPDAPYIARLREARADELYRVYLEEREAYADSTAFFLDAADALLERGHADLGVRVLSNLAEMDLENRHVLRILGTRLMQAERPALAVGVFRKVRDLAPEEPQSFRDLGLAYAANRQHQAAVDALWQVIVRPWHGRFPEVELITLAELNAIVAQSDQALDLSRIDPRLLRNLPLDLRVVLTWDADNTDIDLWVTDPNGERAYYGNRLTYQGGRMSQDFTGGYGPEEFSLRHAKPGKYKVEAQFYGNRQQIVAGATTLGLRLTTGFGTAKQKDQAVTLRLRGRGEVVQVGEFEVAAD